MQPRLLLNMKTALTPLRAKLIFAFLLSAALFTTSAQAQEVPASGFWLAADPSTVSYALTGPAVSRHQRRTSANRPYNENNIGLGFEQRADLLAAPQWERAVGASVLKDSYNAAAVFATVALTREMGTAFGMELRAGVVAGLAYKYWSWDGPHHLTPYLGPTLTLRHLASKLGLNLVYIYRTNFRTDKGSGLLILQTSYEF
jgi:hypothetical protein